MPDAGRYLVQTLLMPLLMDGTASLRGNQNPSGSFATIEEAKQAADSIWPPNEGWSGRQEITDTESEQRWVRVDGQAAWLPSTDEDPAGRDPPST